MTASKWTIFGLPGVMPTSLRRTKRCAPACPKRWLRGPATMAACFCNLIASIDHAIANGMARENAEAAGGLVWRGKYCFVCLNAFPYTSGHVMVVPYAHLDRLAVLLPETAHEMMDLAQRTERVLDQLYSPHGYQFRAERGEGSGRGRGRASASACDAALDGGYQFYDDGGRNAGLAGGSGDDLEADA